MVCTITSVIVYKFFLPTIIAKTLSAEKLPDYIPQRIKIKIEKVNKPLNETARNVINTIHSSGITIEQLIRAIDEAKEEHAYSMLDELNKTKITNVDQLFDMAKKYFPVDFDVEVFRDAYRKKATIPLIEKAIMYANKYKNERLMDAQTAKETAKRILRTKEAEFNRIIAKDSIR
ncbi:MAG: hypothetical protein ACKVOQ_18370 [Cyclobacteriaceae bacterium]